MFAERNLMVKEEQRKDYLRQRELERLLPAEPPRGDAAAKGHRELSGGVAGLFFRLARAVVRL